MPLLKQKPVVDGNKSDWKLANWAQIDTRRLQVSDWGGKEVATRAALAVSGDRLYGIFETDGTDLLKNAGTELQTLFKSGGGLDVMIGAAGADPQRFAAVAGDLRLLISRVGDKPVDFISQVKTVKIDRIENISADLELASTQEKDDKGKVLSATYEFSIPLARLGLKPESGMTLRGDVGVLRGDGLRTMQRVYWNNKSSGLTSDTPSEAELVPRLWGTLQFQAAQ